MDEWVEVAQRIPRWHPLRPRVRGCCTPRRRRRLQGGGRDARGRREGGGRGAWSEVRGHREREEYAEDVLGRTDRVLDRRARLAREHERPAGLGPRRGADRERRERPGCADGRGRRLEERCEADRDRRVEERAAQALRATRVPDELREGEARAVGRRPAAGRTKHRAHGRGRRRGRGHMPALRRGPELIAAP